MCSDLALAKSTSTHHPSIHPLPERPPVTFLLPLPLEAFLLLPLGLGGALVVDEYLKGGRSRTVLLLNVQTAALVFIRSVLILPTETTALVPPLRPALVLLDPIGLGGNVTTSVASTTGATLRRTIEVVPAAAAVFVLIDEDTEAGLGHDAVGSAGGSRPTSAKG